MLGEVCSGSEVNISKNEFLDWDRTSVCYLTWKVSLFSRLCSCLGPISFNMAFKSFLVISLWETLGFIFMIHSPEKLMSSKLIRGQPFLLRHPQFCQDDDNLNNYDSTSIWVGTVSSSDCHRKTWQVFELVSIWIRKKSHRGHSDCLAEMQSIVYWVPYVRAI